MVTDNESTTSCAIMVVVDFHIDDFCETEFVSRRNYSIFFDPATHQLFAYVEIEDEARWQAVAKTEVCQRWWRFMGDIMPGNPDHSPVSRGLTEVFHLD